MEILAVIDAETMVYQAVLKNSEDRPKTDRQGRREWYTAMVEEDARQEITMRIEDVERELRASRVLLAFGGENNWRKQVLPSYKAERARKKPCGYWALVDWMCEEWESLSLPSLEADDTVGLLATGAFPEIVQGRDVIMVSEDKDMKSIPGRLYTPRKPQDGVRESCLTTANYWHMMQTLTGDTADGYKGCPGVGPKGAEKLLKAAPRDGVWGEIVRQYEKKDLTEDDALIQAQVARILRRGDYDPKTGNLRLWTPARLKPFREGVNPWREN